MRKDKILSELQESAFRKFELLREGLVANDRAKYYFALLGLAQAHAFDPSAPVDGLESERQKAGIEDAWLDEVAALAAADGDDVVVPRGKEVLQRAAQETKIMVEAVSACGAPEAGQFGHRLRLIEEEIARAKEDRLGAALIGRMLSGERGRADGLHLLVMDAHKALNRLGVELAEEKIDGAAVFGIDPEDRELVAAFMRGVNRTSPLRFDHPGLDTTATRLKTQLLIQNDIGETDAHVFLCAVRSGAVEVTYTDVHEKRADFFQKSLAPLSPRWQARSIKQAKDLPESSDYYLVRGTIPWSDSGELCHALTEIGAKLAFLIDWNKARKALRTFIKGGDAVRMLAWSTQEEIGHMAFLKLGGRDLIYEVLELLEPGMIRPGEPLKSVLGDEATLAFLRDTLKIASLGLRGNESELLVRDRVKAAFVRYFQTLARGPLMNCRDLLGLVVEGALTVRDMLRALARGDRGFITRSVRRLCAWEEESDRIVNRIRKTGGPRPGATDALTPAVLADDAQDALEEAAHLIGLIAPEKLPEQLRFGLEEAGDLCVRAAQEGYKAVASAEEAFNEATALDDFSRSIDRLDGFSHRAEELRREFRRLLLAGPELGSAFAILVKDCAGELTTATESLARAGFALHRTVFDRSTKR